jgi:hypothetical protein
VFAPVVNLVNERAEILSVVVPEIGNGPFSLVVEGGGFDQSIDIHSLIRLRAGQLHLGGVSVLIDHPQVWHPRPDWETLKRVNFTSAIRIIERIIEASTPGDHNRATAVGVPTANSLQGRILEKASSGITTLFEGLGSRDLDTIRSGAARLAGLGTGLTPAGDDFMVGVMHGLWAIHHQETALRLCETLCAAAVPRTNTLSAAWLKAASQGEAGEPWHLLFEAILSNQPIQVERAASRILSTGHTSGADTLGGFLYTLKSGGGT